MTISSLTWAALAPGIVVYSARKTSGAAAGAGCGLILNSTLVAGATVNSFKGWTDINAADEAVNGYAWITFGARLTNYTAGCTGYMNTKAAGGTDETNLLTKMQNDAQAVTAKITTIIIRGISGSSSVTLAVDEAHVYALATS